MLRCFLRREPGKVLNPGEYWYLQGGHGRKSYLLCHVERLAILLEPYKGEYCKENFVIVMMAIWNFKQNV